MLSVWKWGPRGKRASDLRMTRAARRPREEALAAAIEGDAIDIRYQPQLDPATGEVVAVEALARWEGAANADELFARARKAQLDERLSRQVTEKAIRQAARWTGAMARIDLSVNILPKDLGREDYADWLLGILAEEGFEPRQLTVEIVENGLLADAAAAAKRLTRLREAGIKVAIDDFGTGYASLAWLTGLPLDTLKIDRGLVADIVGKDKDRIVMRAMLHLAQDLGLKTVVEGVEHPAQLALLAAWGCDLYQGFLGSEPLSEIELARFIAAANIDVA